VLAPVLSAHARSLGADWSITTADQGYRLAGTFVLSSVTGDSGAIARLQRSSARYFQRPDADYVTLDPSATTLTGTTASLAIQKVNGKHWLWTAGTDVRSPGFELNDAGSMSSADLISSYGELRYRENQPHGLLRRWTTYFTPSLTWNLGGTPIGSSYYLDFEPTWKNWWRSWFTFVVSPRTQSATLTRGGPLAQQAGAWAGIAQLANSASSKLRWNGRIYYGQNEEGHPTYRLSGGLSVRPGPQWELSVTPNYLRTTPVRQYIATFDGGPAATFGKTYVFAAVDRSEFIAETRLTYLFTPDLSLEFYAQPFASSGRYFDFGELPRAGAYGLTPIDGGHAVRDGDVTRVTYGADTRTVRDFNVRSFRSNAVLRWEWRPGSTLFVVWQQDRSGDRDDISHVGVRSLFETLDTPGDNFLAIKLTYWLPLH